jgi:hypothetical protein
MHISSALSMFREERPTDRIDEIKKQKYERAARQALCDLVGFDQLLQDEMDLMLTAAAAGQLMDHAMFDLMIKVRTHHAAAMNGLLELDDNQERNALIAYSDAVHDLMLRLHAKGSMF